MQEETKRSLDSAIEELSSSSDLKDRMLSGIIAGALGAYCAPGTEHLKVVFESSNMCIEGFMKEINRSRQATKD